MATLLLDRGANPDLTNNLGQKPRDVAQLHRHHRIVLSLDSYNARKTSNLTSHEQATADRPTDS
ncbi:hypothetical protein L211DRAFT_841385 [Terfezia boudieri ATCC MYA-4762]|uniref:Ankyrin n=1 Tax=Terfezia boudieri ATCC MYA-4762 TaxID=1051890 RepID=A0A3N4LJ43_9PEZI|nr:hypothetical protein L211DRAFT_841385 [Terfezia boudieri ATCC MYA-4762]